MRRLMRAAPAAAMSSCTVPTSRCSVPFMGARRGLASLMTTSSEVSARTAESLQGSGIEEARVRRVLEDTAASRHPPRNTRKTFFTTETRRSRSSIPFFSPWAPCSSWRRPSSLVCLPLCSPEVPDSKPNPVLDIADCDIIIANCNMKLGEKIRYLRLVEGTLRDMGREMTQQDLVVALKKEMGSGLSQSYLSQIERGARPHLTNASRMLLARFFKVHPGYLVDDPEGYHTELTSDLRAMEDRLDLWLINGAEQHARDPELSQALLQVAKHKDSRKCLLLLGAILEAPELVDRLTEVLKPGAGELNGGVRRRKSAGAIL